MSDAIFVREKLSSAIRASMFSGGADGLMAAFAAMPGVGPADAAYLNTREAKRWHETIVTFMTPSASDRAHPDVSRLGALGVRARRATEQEIEDFAHALFSLYLHLDKWVMSGKA